MCLQITYFLETHLETNIAHRWGSRSLILTVDVLVRLNALALVRSFAAQKLLSPELTRRYYKGRASQATLIWLPARVALV